MKTKLLKKVRKNFSIVEYKGISLGYDPSSWYGFSVMHKGFSLNEYWYDIFTPKRHKDNLSREEAFNEAWERLKLELRTRYAKYSKKAKKKDTTEEILWPPEKSGWWVEKEINPQEEGI